MSVCPHPRCARPIDPARFACPAHWRPLPRAIKQRIIVAWREIRSPGGGERHYQAGLLALDHWEKHRR